MKLKEALKIKYPDNTDEDIDITINDMIELVEQGENPEQILYDEGLEPDYIMDLLEMML